MDTSAPLAPGIFDLRVAGATAAAVIVVQQLDQAGQVYRTFTSYPRDEAEVAAKLVRIELAYNLAATRVTVSCLPR
jgi:hypothetical protein